jgi:hypothetical protein
MKNITNEIEHLFYIGVHVKFEAATPTWVNDCGTQYVSIVSTIYGLTRLNRF